MAYKWGVILTILTKWDDPPSRFFGSLGWLPRLDGRNHMEPKNHLREKETHLQQHHSQASPRGFVTATDCHGKIPAMLRCILDTGTPSIVVPSEVPNLTSMTFFFLSPLSWVGLVINGLNDL